MYYVMYVLYLRLIVVCLLYSIIIQVLLHVCISDSGRAIQILCFISHILCTCTLVHIYKHNYRA